MKQYLLDRIAEPSTWRGLVIMATALGVNINPEQISAIITIGMMIAGAIGALAKDNKSITERQ